MTILLNSWGEHEAWFETLSDLLPDEEIVVWPECGDRQAVEMMVAWRLKRADLATFTNLHTIFSMGAGVDQWLREGSPEVRLVRLADPAMADEMATYAVHWVSHFQRGFDARYDPADLDTWGTNSSPVTNEYRVGLLGFGEVGGRIGREFAGLGYQVRAWTRSGVEDPGVKSFAGLGELAAFLGDCDAVINVLPRTEATTGLLTADRFSQFRPGATFLNMGRGTVIADEGELVAAVDDGRLGAVVLDVTNPEPPAADAPILHHPKIRVTPHISGRTRVSTAAGLIAANIDRIRRGEAPFPVVDRGAGY